MYTDCTTQDNVVFDSVYIQKNNEPDFFESALSIGGGAIARPVRTQEVGTFSTEGGMTSWEIVIIPSPASSDQTRSQQDQSVNKWPILSFAAVCDFCELRKGYDLDAMQHIFDLVSNEFSGFPAEYELVSEDSDSPELILRVDTHDLPMQQLIEKELRVFEVIARSVTLSNANKYNILSIV